MLDLYVDRKGGVIRWPATGREHNLCRATFYDNAEWKKEGIDLNASRCPHTDTSRSLHVPLSKNNSVVFPLIRTVRCRLSKPSYSCCVMTDRVDSEMCKSRFIPVVWWLIVWTVRSIKANLFLLLVSLVQTLGDTNILPSCWPDQGLNKLTMSTDESIWLLSRKPGHLIDNYTDGRKHGE